MATERRPSPVAPVVQVHNIHHKLAAPLVDYMSVADLLNASLQLQLF